MITILKDISIYTIGDFLTKGIGFFAIIFYTYYISQAEIGVYGYILVIIGFVNTFLILGADNAYARYFYEHKTHKDRQILTTTLFVFLSIWMVFILILPIIYSEDISLIIFDVSDYKVVLLLAFLSLPLKLISSMSNQALRNQFKTKKFIIFNFTTAFTSVLISILLLKYFEFGLSSIFLGMIIADILIIPFRLYAIKELFIKKIDLLILKKILAYGIPILPASIAYLVFSSADRVMLESMSTLENVGVYTIAASLAAIMSIISSGIGQAWSPHAVKAYENNQDSAKILYARFLNALIVIAIFVIFNAAMIGNEVITYIFPQEYKDVFYPMLVLLIGIGFKITTQVTAAGIGLKKKTIYMFYITIFVAIINIFLNYFLIQYYNELGASIATMLSFILLTTMYTLITQKLFKVEYYKSFIFKAFLLLIAIIGLSFLNIEIRFFILITVYILIFNYRDKIMEYIR